jgi:NAD(P)-dependent dehydrogenase (short-subunit alcohol dehydrogenase family)
MPRAARRSEAEWRRVVGTDLDAVFFWAQEAARRMLAAGKGGAIVNVASRSRPRTRERSSTSRFVPIPHC